MIKKILIILIIPIILFVSLTPPVNAVSSTDDVLALQYFQYNQDMMASKLVLHFMGFYLAQSQAWDYVKENILNKLFLNAFYVDDYQTMSMGPGFRLSVNFYFPTYFSVDTQLAEVDINGSTVSVEYFKTIEMDTMEYYFDSFSQEVRTDTHHDSTSSPHIPVVLTSKLNHYSTTDQVMYLPQVWVDFMEFVNSSSGGSGGSSIDYDRLQQIIETALDGAGADDETVQNISNSVNEIKTAVEATQKSAEATQKATEATQKATEATQETTKQIEDFLKNKSVSDNSYNQTSVKVPDNSSADLDGIFDKLKSMFVDGESVDIVLPIPFTDSEITIPSTLTRDILGEKGKFLIELIELVYNVLLATFIVKDVNKYITKLKDGSIVEGSDTDIKSDML